MNSDIYNKYEKIFLDVKNDILSTLATNKIDISKFVDSLGINEKQFFDVMAAKDVPLSTYLDILSLVYSNELKEDNNNEAKIYRNTNYQDKKY